MKNFGIALAVIAALTLGALGTAQAHKQGRRDGADRQTHTPTQHRATPRTLRHSIDRRHARQRARIRQGWRSGRLNRNEVARLHREQKRLNRMERRFRADGRYTRHERRIMQRWLDRSSRRIWRMKHNRYRAKPGYRQHKNYHRGLRRPRYH